MNTYEEIIADNADDNASYPDASKCEYKIY